MGDHVLGRGTSVVTHPEGDVVAYLESLRRVHDLGPSALYCGHGPELTEDPGVNVALGVTSGDPTSALDVTLALADVRAGRAPESC